MFGSNSQSLKSVPSQQKLSERLKRHCATKVAKLMYSYMRHQVDSPFDTVVHGELWAYSLDAFRAEAEDLDLTQHTDPILAGRPAFCQKLRKNKMTYLNRTCFKHLTSVRQVDIKVMIGRDEVGEREEQNSEQSDCQF